MTPNAPPPDSQPPIAQSLNWGDRLFQQSLDLLCVLNLEGAFLQLNPSWERVLGYSPEQLQGTMLLQWLHPDDRPLTQSALEQVVSGVPVHHLCHRFQLQDGSDRWLEWTLSPDLPAQRIYGIARDISQTKQREAEHQQIEQIIRKEWGETELRVAERTAELVSINHRLERELEERRHVEQVLRFAQARFAGILEIADDAVISVDSQQHITLFNQGAEKIFGYIAGEVLHQPLDLLLPERFTRAHRQHVKDFSNVPGQARRMGERGQIYGRRKDGSEFPAEASISRLTLGDEQIFTVILRDISDRKRAEEELQRLSHQNELILSSVGEGLFGLDLQGKTTVVNPAAARLLGYRPEDLLHQSIQMILPAVQPDGIPYHWEDSPIFTALQSGTSHQVNDAMFRQRDGSTFPVEYMVTPIWEHQQIVGAVMIFRDVSDRRIIERMKDEFISVVSHELRTPLTSIHGSLGMLASGLLSADSERGKRLLEIAVDSTDRLMRLINDILDIERIESGKVSMAKQDCNIADLFQQTVEVMQSMAEKASVQLAVAPLDVPLWADPDRIIQTLTNLLSNAIKFSPPDATVWLTAEQLPPAEVLALQESTPSHSAIAPCTPPHPEEEPWLVVSVRDLGRGIPADKLETIFERFQQVDASDSRNHDGTGLGLAICRSIVQQHGGVIWVESVFGEGSTFYFTLPIAISEPLSDNPENTLILVCDDDPGIRVVLQTMLQQRSYQVLTAASGQEAIDLATVHCPDVILLDLLMPQMNGWEVIAALKERPNTRDIPVVICSVIAPSDQEAPSADFVDWLGKPLDEPSLLRSLRQVLARATGRVRVLIVEDDPDLAEVLITRLELHGIDTLHATTGREAIRLSQQFNPDLLILDLILPDRDGFAVVEWLQQHSSLQSVPLVVYSARDLNAIDRDRLKLGQTEFLSKGRVSAEDFEHRVMELLCPIIQNRRKVSA